MALTIAPFPKHYFTDNNGFPAVGYLLFTYAAGTTTKLATYTDVDGTAANTNPVVLDSSGRCTLFLLPASYDFVLAPPDDTDPPTSPIWTQPNVAAVGSFSAPNDVTGTAGEDIVAREAVYLADGTEGGTIAGRWYKTDASAANTSSNAISLGFAVADAATAEELAIRVVGKMDGFSALVVGATYFLSTTAGEITTTNPGPPGSRGVAQADSSTSLVVLYGMKSYIP